MTHWSKKICTWQSECCSEAVLLYIPWQWRCVTFSDMQSWYHSLLWLKVSTDRKTISYFKMNHFLCFSLLTSFELLELRLKTSKNTFSYRCCYKVIHREIDLLSATKRFSYQWLIPVKANGVKDYYFSLMFCEEEERGRLWWVLGCWWRREEDEGRTTVYRISCYGEIYIDI